MYEFAFNAHSGLRYLVLLVGVLTALYGIAGMLRKTPVDKTAVTLVRVFGVTLDIQLLLGIVTLISGQFFGQLIGHIVLMIAAVAVAHLGAVRLKKAAPAQRGYGLVVASALIPLALIIGGILAIQRAIV
jgi:hypothetical protein